MLLRGFRLQVDTVQGGIVAIEALPNFNES